jgi:hypothetical protein
MRSISSMKMQIQNTRSNAATCWRSDAGGVELIGAVSQNSRPAATPGHIVGVRGLGTAVICALLAVVVLAPPAHAFSPGVHRALAERAVAIEAESAPSLAGHADRVGRAAAWEDYNLARKWLRFNHYYSPSFEIPTLWRRPSNERVAGLLDDIGRALGVHDDDRAFADVGAATHHVQDMASPPHVVPVGHGLGDGFESWDMDGLVGLVRGDDVPAMDPAAA